MALPILDGNQSATTLSSILTSGEHIPAHTVVSLGTQAITDISGAVSGSVVSISSLPAISGTVTANTQTQYYDPVNGINLQRALVSFIEDEITGESYPVDSANGLPISGTVTANLSAIYVGEAPFSQADKPMMAVGGLLNGFDEIRPIRIDLNTGGQIVAGTVTANLNDPTTVVIANQIDDALFGSDQLINALNASLSLTNNVPISGTVTVGNSVTIASFATSVTARLINPAGTAVTYAEVGTAGSPSIDVLSVQGVTAGSPVITTLLLSSTAITSGSFTSLASATLVPGNTARKMATVYNLGAGQLFVNAGATATTLGGGFMVALSSGDFYECDYTTTTLSAIFATAGTASWMSH